MGFATKRHLRSFVWCLIWISYVFSPSAWGQMLSGDTAYPGELVEEDAEAAKLDRFEQRIFELQAEVDALQQQALTHSSVCPAAYALSYDDGWVIRPSNKAESPFELKFNIHNQYRYTGFANSVDSFRDAAGNLKPVSGRNDFDINRGRFVFSGFAFHPQLQFYTNIDYNTVSARPVQLLLSRMTYRFGDRLALSMGLGKVPGTWEWQQSSRFTLGAERTMATTFFRPSITAGVWAQGKLGERVYYHALIGDGFNTFTLQAAELDTNLVYSAMVWRESAEGFGVGASDLEYSDTLRTRAGVGFTFAANDSDPLGEPGPEQTVIRLTDGTRLVEDGALAPGVRVNRFDVSLCSIHCGIKYRGYSLSTEYFLRWLSAITGNGPLPIDSLFDHGWYAQGGLFLVPIWLEAFARGSQVHGDFGTGTEMSTGLNWYVGGQRGNRFTAEVSQVDDSPAQQDRTGFVTGGTGTLVRFQWWHFF